MTELEQYINSYFGVTDSDMARIASLFKPVVIKKGDYFLRTGVPSDNLSFIQSGFLRVYATLEDKEVTQWVASKGYFITDLSSLVFGGPSRWNIQAMTEVHLYAISKPDYNRIADLVPLWPAMEKAFIVKCFTIMENRIFAHLSMSAEERYTFFYNHNKELFTQIPQQYLASMLGMTPETFSRIRKKQLH